MKKTRLQRHLEKLGLSDTTPPTDAKAWQEFLAGIEKSFIEADAQRVFNEDLLAASSKEMTSLLEKLKMASQANLQLEANKLSAVIEGIPSLVAWVDQKGHILGANSKLAQLAGMKKDELPGCRFSDLKMPALHEFLISFLSNDQSESLIELALIIESQTLYFKFVARKFNQNSMVAIIGIDVTDDIRKQKELEDARMSSIAASRMAVLGEMAGGIAHEINNPLAVIHGIAELLSRKASTTTVEQIVERAENIKATAQRAAKIISGLRAFARNEAQDPFSRVLVKNLVSDTLELSKSQIEKLGIDLMVSSIPNDLALDCRPGQICQVLLNLLNNAKDAIKESPNPWIRIEVNSDASRVRFKVTDSGTGIKPELREKIFHPFFTTKEAGVGTGLGLSISLGIVKDHAGSFTIDEDKPNTCFVVDLPKKHLQSQDLIFAGRSESM